MVEAGGGFVAHGWRFQAAVLLFHAVERAFPAFPFSSIFFPLLLLRFLFFLFLFRCVFQLLFLFLFQYHFFLSPHGPYLLSLTIPLGLFSLIVPLPCFLLPRFLSVPFLFVLFFSPLTVLSRFVLLCKLVLGGIYRVKGAGTSLLLPYCYA